jgi:hypothetical protein
MKIVTTLAIAAVLQTGSAQPAVRAQPRSCLHGTIEAPADKVRREAALTLARAITDAETRGKAGGRYQPLAVLNTLPAVPGGFRLQLTTDGSTYLFSLKDGLDVCGYAIFSDQHGFVYEGAPINRPGIRPLTGS